MNFNGEGAFGRTPSSSGSFTVLGDLTVTGRILMSDGEEDEPSLAFISDETLGFYKSDEGQISVVSNEQTLMDIGDTGVTIHTGLTIPDQSFVMRYNGDQTVIDGVVLIIDYPTEYLPSTGSSITWDSGTKTFTLHDVGKYVITGYIHYEDVDFPGLRSAVVSVKFGDASYDSIGASDVRSAADEKCNVPFNAQVTVSEDNLPTLVQIQGSITSEFSTSTGVTSKISINKTA